MKKFKLHLLLLALLSVGAAWVNKPLTATKFDIHTYSFLSRTSDGTRIYYGKDLTDAGYIKGLDYDCLSGTMICTFMGNPLLSHTDFGGNYFFTSQIPEAGYDNSGIFDDLWYY